MRIQVQDLQKNGYVLFESFSIDHIMPFVQQQLRSKHWLVLAYWAINILLAGFLGAWAALSPLGFDEIFAQVGLGFASLFIFIIPHELIHAFFFWFFGAKKIVIKAQWRKLIFYAAAHGFVHNRREFICVAAMPFIIINFFLIILYVLLKNYEFCIMAALLAHSSACGGDFALMSYFLKHGDMLTYDDLDEKVSYFYKKNS